MIASTRSLSVVTNEADRKAYFQPFESNGRACCGATRQKCSTCQYRFSQEERFTLECPECGHDRKCRKLSMKNGRCGRHSGKIKSGISAPNFKHGRYAEQLPGFPKEVQDAFLKATASAEMQSVGREYGLVQARLLLLAESLGGAESRHLWRELAAQKAIIDKERVDAQQGDKAAETKVAAAVDRVLDLIESGSSDANKWEEILALNKESAHLKVAQGKIERGHHLYLSAAQAMEFVTLISRGVKEAFLLVKGRVAQMREAVIDEVQLQAYVEDAVQEIETAGADPRDVIERVCDKLVSLLPLDSVESSLLEANAIVQDRIRSMVGK